MTTTIKSFDRPTIKALRAEIDAALKAVADRHGIAITSGSATFSDANVSLKIQLATLGEGGAVNTREAEDFRRNAASFGLAADDLGRSFFSRGKTYTLVGASVKSYKYPLLCRDDGGKVMKFRAESVRSLLMR